MFIASFWVTLGREVKRVWAHFKIRTGSTKTFFKTLFFQSSWILMAVSVPDFQMFWKKIEKKKLAVCFYYDNRCISNWIFDRYSAAYFRSPFCKPFDMAKFEMRGVRRNLISQSKLLLNSSKNEMKKKIIFKKIKTFDSCKTLHVCRYRCRASNKMTSGSALNLKFEIFITLFRIIPMFPSRLLWFVLGLTTSSSFF